MHNSLFVEHIQMYCMLRWWFTLRNVRGQLSLLLENFFTSFLFISCCILHTNLMVHFFLCSVQLFSCCAFSTLFLLFIYHGHQHFLLVLGSLALSFNPGHMLNFLISIINGLAFLSFFFTSHIPCLTYIERFQHIHYFIKLHFTIITQISTFHITILTYMFTPIFVFHTVIMIIFVLQHVGWTSHTLDRSLPWLNILIKNTPLLLLRLWLALVLVYFAW